VWESICFFVETEAERLFELHQVDCVGGEGDEYYLHDENVERFPTEKEVQVAA